MHFDGVRIEAAFQGLTPWSGWGEEVRARKCSSRAVQHDVDSFFSKENENFRIIGSLDSCLKQDSETAAFTTVYIENPGYLSTLRYIGTYQATLAA